MPVHTDTHLVLILDKQPAQSTSEDLERPRLDLIPHLFPRIKEGLAVFVLEEQEGGGGPPAST